MPHRIDAGENGRATAMANDGTAENKTVLTHTYVTTDDEERRIATSSKGRRDRDDGGNGAPANSGENGWVDGLPEDLAMPTQASAMTSEDGNNDAARLRIE
uniref:DUF834 domain-containing protein n=1 Tax=Oryza barthii TaxID=65489 RepID=A0A0D3HT25_9ORYZ